MSDPVRNLEDRFSHDEAHIIAVLMSVASSGGCGGGILILNALELCKINGKLSANGQDASSRGGGGAGGSIHITTYEFDGTGEIQVL